MKSDFTLAFNEIVESRALPKEKVLEALEQALVSAYRRDSKAIDAQKVVAEFDATGHPRLRVEKEVVRDVISPQTEISLEDARQKVDPDVQEGDMVMAPVETLSENFGRIAAQTAKQVILQHIREAERESLYTEFIDREGDLVIGTVQSISQNAITLDLGRAEAVMPPQHRMPNEKYRPHDKTRVYIVEVKKTNRGPQIIVSRSHKNLLKRLLEYEVPEIYNGQVEIKNIAREAGFRSKVAVAAQQEGIDAVGACVGMRGIRIQNIVKELNDEKIDIIEWDQDAAKYIARALSPARVTKVFLEDELDTVRTATVIVPDDQLSLAIGREGQNARLAAKLTGWRIDIKSVFEAAQSAIAHLNEPPLRNIFAKHGDLIEDARRILEKKTAKRVVTPEEYTKLARFVELSEGQLFGQREVERRERREAIAAVRPLVPEAAFSIPLEELELAEDIMRVIGRLGNVGELWIRYMADEEGLRTALVEGGADIDAMEAIRDALDDLVVPEVVDKKTEEPPVAEVVEAEAIPTPAPEAAQPEVVEEVSFADAIQEDLYTKQVRGKSREEVEPEFIEEEDTDDDAAFRKDKKKGTKKKAGKNKRRQLVFDEDAGEVIAKRRRKRGDGDDYEEYY